MDQGSRSRDARAGGTAGTASDSLLQRVKGRDEEGWRRLTDLYGPLVYGWCRRKGLSAEDAADVVQETFSAVYGGIGRFRRDRPGDSFLAWLRSIARNKIRDRFRQIRDGAREGSTSAKYGGSGTVGRL